MRTEKQTRLVMISIRANIAVPLLFLLATSVSTAQTAKIVKPGVKGIQVPFASLKPSATVRIGWTADWVLVTKDAVWVAGTKPYSVQRINPITNRIVAKILYHTGKFVFRNEYEISTDVKSFFEEQDPALDRLAKDFA